ncbi:YCR076C-like protein [Saccharomyces cerevisiae x Saccharomyces kudriavzevii VIN7]|uniref:YCR076C-like protein n=1 Tax=Saccharomyces cerevisiae x Saccharomyces kudriavzevii (strain VIN7) TaxID=1095631 RepID=H0GRZ5_SACCK|nr:YCR076C-like protein [Saccharomyces cerevisiae x Saccharomyces kudriavzevii VIN7]
MIESKVELVAELVLESIGKTDVVSRHTVGAQLSQVSFHIAASSEEEGASSPFELTVVQTLNDKDKYTVVICHGSSVTMACLVSYNDFKLPTELKWPLEREALPVEPDLKPVLTQLKKQTTDSAEIPKFDDEYQAQTRQNQGAAPLNPYPGLTVTEPSFTNPESGYADRDLYPMGTSHPDWSRGLPNSLGAPGSQGGMIFDPNRRPPQRREDMPPGWMPGSKYDEPFGPGSSGFGSSGPGFF